MPAAVIVVAAAASGVAAYVGGAVVSALALGTISAAATTAIGVGIVAGGVTAIQGGSTSDILKSAVLSGIGSYVGGQVASKVTNSVSAATGAPAGTGLTAGAAGTTGLTAGSAGASGITAGAGAGATLGTGITPTTLGILAGNVAGQATQAAITGQDIGEAALFGAAISIGPALNQSKDFRSLDKTTQNVIIASSQAVVMGQDIPEAALSALVQSSNIVAKAINEIPGGNKFIRDNPIYTRYIIDSVSSALTAELLNKNVNDALIASLARTTGRILGQKFEDAATEQKLRQSQEEYGQLQQKERELIMVQERLETLNNDSRYARALKNFENASTWADHYYSIYQGNADAAKQYEKAFNDVERSFGFAGPETVKRQQDLYAGLYERAVNEANKAAANYEQFAPGKQEAYDALEATGYFREQGKIVRDFNAVKSEYDRLANSVTAIADELARSNAELFTSTSNEALSEIERFAEIETVQAFDPLQQYAQGFRVDITGTATPLFKTPDNRFIIYENLALIDRNKDFDEQGYEIQLTPEEFQSITGIPYEEALASNRLAVGELGGQEAPIEDIAGIPSFTGTAEAEARQLGFVIGVDLRKEASPQTGGGQAIYRPAETTGTTGTGGGTSSWRLIGRDSATGAEKVDVDGEGFTLIALPNNRQALVSDTREVILYPYKDPLTNEVNLIERPVNETEVALALSSTPGQAGPSRDELFSQIIDDELDRLEQELEQSQQNQQQVQANLERAVTQRQRFTGQPDTEADIALARTRRPSVLGGQGSTLGRLSPDTQAALDAEIRALESQLQQSSREVETAAAERERFGALQQEGASAFTDDDISRFLETGEFPGGSAEAGVPQEGGGGLGGGAKGDGTGLGGEGKGEGVDEDALEPITEESALPQAVVTLGPEFAERPGTTPFASRVTGEALEGILGEKQPLFGGDDDEQRAVWNRRSLRLLSRALGI